MKIIKAPTGLAAISYGNYTGNDGTNRAIPHTLGKIPQFVLITCQSNSVTHAWLVANEAFIFPSGAAATVAVTAMTTSNFYIGNGAFDGGFNHAAKVYYWTAVG